MGDMKPLPERRTNPNFIESNKQCVKPPPERRTNPNFIESYNQELKRVPKTRINGNSITSFDWEPKMVRKAKNKNMMTSFDFSNNNYDSDNTRPKTARYDNPSLKSTLFKDRENPNVYNAFKEDRDCQLSSSM